MAKRIDIDVNLRDEKAKEDLQKLQNGKYNVNLNVNGSGTDKTTQKIQKLANEAKNTQSAFDKLKNTIGGVFSGKSLAFTAYLTAMNEIRKAANGAKAEIKDLDQSITDLSVAMGQGRSAASDYLKQLNQQAQSIGATTKEVADSADSWLRQGKSAKEAGKLVYDSMMLSKLGQIQSADASKYLTSALNGYKKSASEAIDVVDKLTAVDMQSASDAGGLAESMSKTASAADMAGVSMDKLIGMIASVKEVTQDSDESVGNMFKSVFSRMNQIKAGKFVDSDTGESLNDTEKVLNKVGIAMRDTNNQFISSEKIMDEVGAKWSSFDSTTQRAVATAMAGTYQYNKLIALFNNYSKALDYTKTSAESAGTAIEKFNSSYKESLEAKTNSLQASFESMLMNSDMNKVYAGIIEATNALVKFIDKTGALKGVLSGLAVGGAIKAFTIIKTATNEAYINLNKFKNALDIVGKTRVSTNNFDRLLSLTSGLSMSQLKLVVSSKALTQAQRKQLLMSAGLSAEEAELQLKNWNLIRSNTGLTASTTSLKNAFSSLWTMMKANPIAVVTTVLTAGMAIWQKYKQSIEEAVSSASEASDTYKNQSQTIEEMVSKYQNLQKQLLDAKGDEKKTASVKEQLLELQQQLNEQFGDEYGKLNLVTDAYKDQTNAIKAYNKEAANTLLNDNRKGIEEATKQMTENKTYSLGTMNGLLDADELPIREKIKKLAEDNNIDFSHNGFEFTGNAEEAQKAINVFMNSLKELQKQSGNTSDTMSGIFDGLLDSSGEALSKANNITSKYKEIYQQAQLAEIATDDKLSSEYDTMTEAVEKYNNAISNSKNPYDDQNVESAYENLQKIKQKISDNSEWKKYKDIIDQTFDDADTKSYSFYIALKNNKNGVNDLANQLKGLSVTDVKSMIDDGNNGDAFDKINEKASKFGLSAEDVISILQQFGIIIENVESKTDTATTALVSFDEAWINLKNTDDSDLKGVADDLLDLANAGQLTENSIEKLAGGQKLMSDTGLSAEELARKINSLVNASTQLSSMSAQISKMSDMLADKKNGTVASASDLAGFDVSVRGLESWDKFEEVMGSSESSMDQCQKAANALATEWVNSENFLANLTDANKQYYITQLDQMGVENASAAVEQALANKRAEEAAQTEYNTTATEYNTKAKTENEKVTTDLTDATPKEVAEILAEASASKAAKKSIAELYLSKLDINNTKINTKDDVNNIVAIAKAAGVSKQYISQLQSALDKLVNGNTYSNGTKFSDLQFGMTSGKIDYSSGLPTIDELKKKGTQQQAKKSAEDIVKQINDSFTEIKMPDIKIKPTGSSSYKSPSSKSSKSKTKSDAAEVFDFIEIKLNNLADKASKAKDRIDDLLTFGQKKNQTKKAIEATTKAITAQEKAYKKYMAYANKAAKKQNSKKTTSSSSSSSGGNAVYDTATDYLGLKYVWGGASLTKGADCSGFTQQIYKKFGVSLPHKASYQAKMGTKINSKSDLQAGDLVFFGSKNNITHVGIYGGDGKFIESHHTGASVRVSKLSSRKDFVSGSRFSGISGSTTTSGKNVKKVKGVSSKTLEHYKKLIREGTLGSDGIASIKNENLKNALKDYQTYYEKAKACKEQVASLTDQLKDLYETLANNPIDSASNKIEKLGTKMDILNAKVGNLTFNPTKKIGTSDIDSLYKQIIKNYDSQLSASKTAYTGATKSYKSNKSSLTKSLKKTKAKNIGLTQKEFNSIKSNLKSNKSISYNLINKIGNDSLREKCIAHNEYLLAKNTATDNYNQAKEDYTSNVRQARKDRFDKVQERYDNKAGLIEQRKNAVSNSLSIAEAKGQLIGEAYYTRQANAVKSDMKLKQEEAGKLAKKLSTIKFGSNEWYEAQEVLNGVYESIQQDEQELAEFQKSINELKFDHFDELLNKLGDITDETDFLIDMLDSDNLFNSDTGMITQDGITAMGLTAQNYDTYLAEAEQYKKQIADLNEMYNDGEIGLTDYNSKLREYQQGQRDSIKSANEAKKSLVAYVKQGLDAQNDALSEEIEKRKKLLEQEKSEKEFNDQTLERSKKIARLKRQIAILENDDSDSNRKNLRQLRSNLQDLEKEEKDSFYDKSISDQEEGLDKMLENSKKQAEDYLKDTNKVFSDALTYVNANSSQVASNINKISKDLGISISTYIVNAWKDGGSAVGTYASTLSSNVPNITAQLSLIESSWQSICKAADEAAEASAKYADTKVTDTQGIGSSNDSGTSSGNGSGSSGNNNDDKQQELNKLRKKASDITEWISKHSVSATHKKSYYGALNQYLYDKQHGQVLSKADEVALAKKLGVSVKSDLSGKNDREKITSALKKLIKDASFSTGGVIKDLVKLSGEDGISFLQRGEAVLSKEQTQALLNFKPVIPQINSIISNLKNIPEKVSSQSPTYQIDNRTIVEGVATDQIVKQMEGVAQKQAENVVKKISQATYYTNGTRYR
nr:MAG TPA: minor tail protein [Caudoviricetes sp.]